MPFIIYGRLLAGRPPSIHVFKMEVDAWPSFKRGPFLIHQLASSYVGFKSACDFSLSKYWYSRVSLFYVFLIMDILKYCFFEAFRRGENCPFLLCSIVLLALTLITLRFLLSGLQPTVSRTEGKISHHQQTTAQFCWTKAVTLSCWPRKR